MGVKFNAKHLIFWLLNVSSPVVYKLSFYQTGKYRDYYTFTGNVRDKYNIGLMMKRGFEHGLRQGATE